MVQFHALGACINVGGGAAPIVHKGHRDEQGRLRDARLCGYGVLAGAGMFCESYSECPLLSLSLACARVRTHLRSGPVRSGPVRLAQAVLGAPRCSAPRCSSPCTDLT
jgi:hypothetical protein